MDALTFTRSAASARAAPAAEGAARGLVAESVRVFVAHNAHVIDGRPRSAERRIEACIVDGDPHAHVGSRFSDGVVQGVDDVGGDFRREDERTPRDRMATPEVPPSC